ncbi:MAG: tetratricopeptide repeat protein [Thermoguttaceae bacterium]
MRFRRLGAAIHLAPTFAAASLLLSLLAGCDRQPARPPAEVPAVSTEAKAEPTQPIEASPTDKKQFVGSKTCYDCHAKFYEIWSTSRHGMAMQPYNEAFAKKELKPQVNEVVIGKQSFRAEIGEKQGWIRETSGDKDGNKETHYPIAHVMGGKNTYYFLTQMPKGRLQVLPVAYDVHKQTWYDTAASGVRHFPDRRQQDEALPWTDRLFTFNTTCFDCHVSQLATNYDLKTDTYHTTWREAGISCESCHGPGGEHTQAMEAGVKGHTSKDIKIIRTLEFGHAQMNDMCATCHAKGVPLSTDFIAGEKFYDHYDLITLEHHDFYPDGRDLGENYTFTSWSMSPCLKSDKLDCNQCHTPSGRPRFEGMKSNQSCLPCHARIVENPTAHSHHKAEGTGNSCIACHMPMSRFAAMARTDHSMRPPMPAATIAYKSPNACNQCHADHDAPWADQWVRKWYPRDYQAEPLRRAGLLDAARKNDWKRLAEMLADVQSKQGDEIYRNSLVRLLRNCTDPKKWPVLITALKDDSPLVRASAAAALEGYLTRESVAALLRATDDPVRLVRIRAAAALASVRPENVDDANAQKSLRGAAAEFKKAMAARPDDWASYSNLGGYDMESGDFDAAVEALETALKLEPRVVAPMVNLSMAYANLKQNDKAEAWLRRALKAEPDNAAANYNLGLLLAETDHLDEAEKALRAALKSDPQLAPAAYNLAVILGGKKDLEGAVQWCRKAHELRPEELKYTQSLAFYLQGNGHKDEAIAVLTKAIKETPSFFQGSAMLAGIYESRGEQKAAARVLSDALEQQGFPLRLRAEWQARIRALVAK